MAVTAHNIARTPVMRALTDLVPMDSSLSIRRTRELPVPCLRALSLRRLHPLGRFVTMVL